MKKIELTALTEKKSGWIVRNKEGDLHIFFTEKPPVLDPIDNYWMTDEDGEVLYLDEDRFPQIKWGLPPVEVNVDITPIAEVFDGTEP